MRVIRAILPKSERDEAVGRCLKAGVKVRYISPLRYPGGKASLAGFLNDVIELNDLRGARYYEPYAGGAGAALALLADNLVSEININDADPRIYQFWRSALKETDRFVEAIHEIRLDIEEWHRQRSICERPAAHDPFEVGFSAFYLNRCNRSGVLMKAGPIGGYSQRGEWTLDVRFNRRGLSERIRQLGTLRDRIEVTHLDAIEFLKRCLPVGRRRAKAFVYLDPPYVNKAERLYLNAYEESDHRQISHYLHRQRALPWLLSYDDTPLIRELYEDLHLFTLPIQYSLQAKRTARELIISPKTLILPRTCTLKGIEHAVPQSN